MLKAKTTKTGKNLPPSDTWLISVKRTNSLSIDLDEIETYLVEERMKLSTIQV